jgi:hypothetical protein
MPVTGRCRISKSSDELNFFLGPRIGSPRAAFILGGLLDLETGVTIITVAHEAILQNADGAGMVQ